MVTAKFIHEHFLGIARSIMYDQPPDVRRVLGLCAAVFLVRELGELQLEQELSARLIFLYRSPRTVIKWAHRRPPARKPPCCQGSRGAVGSSRHVLRPFGLGEAGSLPQPWVPLMPSPCSCSPAESPGLRPPLCPHKGDSVPPLLPDPASCSLCGVGGGKLNVLLPCHLDLPIPRSSLSLYISLSMYGCCLIFLMYAVAF